MSVLFVMSFTFYVSFIFSDGCWAILIGDGILGRKLQNLPALQCAIDAVSVQHLIAWCPCRVPWSAGKICTGYTHTPWSSKGPSSVT